MVLVRHGWFYLSCLAAFTAGHMVNYSVIIYAQEVVGSDLLSGIGFGLCFGPPLALGWYAGVLCDRLAPGRLIHGAQALFLVATLLLWLADSSMAQAGARVPLLVSAAALAGVGWSFVAPARMAALGQIVRPEELKPASVAFNLFVMLGFGLGPLAIALARRGFGWPGVFAAAALLFALSSLALLAVRTRPSGRAHAPVLTEIREGLATVASRPLLLQLMLAAVTGYLAMGPMTVLLPKLAVTRLHLGELQRGWFLGSLALSLIAGGLVALALGRRVHHGRAVFVGTALAGLCLAALGSAHDTRVALALLCAVGIAGGLALSLIVAGIQAQAPEAQRGRVVSMYTIVSQVVPAASGVAAGALVQAAGVGVALQACGATLLVVMLVNALWMRALRAHPG
ncbi:MAG TPA: MFS transporter [Quisquiliibacterium sp.]|nr:MFS transporter [Quisquiliibacterium sp.]